jgi:hypothetical protein
MRLSRSSKRLLAGLLPLLLFFQSSAQELIRDVRLEKTGANLFRVHYQLNPENALSFNTAVLKIYRKRSGKIDEVFSGYALPRNFQPREDNAYTYDWKADAGTVREGDELQAKIIISYRNTDVTEKGQAITPSLQADAGPFMEVQLPAKDPVMLDGTRSYKNGSKIVSFAWKQISGPATLAISSPASAKSLVIGELKPGRYAFELTVKDAAGQSSISRTILTVKPASVLPPVVAETSPPQAGNKKDSVVFRPAVEERATGKLKGGPVNALFNIAVPGVGHYLVSGDPYGHGRKPVAFVVTALYAASAGGAFYYKMKSSSDYNKYLDLSTYREYQRDVNGVVIGVRGANEAEASHYLESSRASRRNAFIFAGVGVGILTADVVYTVMKGLKNKKQWKKDTGATTKLFLSSDGSGLTAGIRLKF